MTKARDLSPTAKVGFIKIYNSHCQTTKKAMMQRQPSNCT